MIRDFWDINEKRLIDAINRLPEVVDPKTWLAIDAVRKVGNIGAHMEDDINLIVDVDPDEAGLLIGLIEYLLKEWYVTRHERETTVRKLEQLAQEKEDAHNP